MVNFIRENILKTEKKTNNYIDAGVLHEEVSKYFSILQKAKAEKKPLPRVPELLGFYIIQICNQVATKSNFNRYSYLSDMISDALMNCTYGCSMFNPNKPNSNAFNYFSTICIQSFIQRIDKEKKQNYIKHSNFVKNFSGIDGNFLEVDGEVNDISNRIVKEFEEKQVEKRIKQHNKKMKKKEKQDEFK